jgi:hypothetical protein
MYGRNIEINTQFVYILCYEERNLGSQVVTLKP